MNGFREIVDGSITVPCRYFLKHTIEDPALDKVGETPAPHYRFVGTLDDLARIIPLDVQHPSIDANRAVITDAVIAGKSVTIFPYLDRPYAYATVRDRMIN